VGTAHSLRIVDFRCIREVTLQLTPLHALIGPNDSGKSTILRALADSSAVVEYPNPSIPDKWQPLNDGRTNIINTTQYRAGIIEPRFRPNPSRPLLRLDPDALRAQTELVPTATKAPWFTDERGTGLAGLYDALLGRDRGAFIRLEERFTALFPTAASLRLDNTEDGKKALGLTLRDGAVVSADAMSEGMLYWLAFSIVEHLAPVEMILIEEPENGLHPSRIREVMKVLREVSKRTQILLATHSPLVINELAPEEVTIVTREPERGTICTPMRETKMFEARSKVYALGELWLSYADGDGEIELVPAAAPVNPGSTQE
jgi:predicted ATPase